MAFELRQELRLSQSLVMTPQLQLAIKLLQLSRLELVEMVREEIQVNPVLDDTSGAESVESVESVESSAESKDEGAEAAVPEVDWQSYLGEHSDSEGYRVNFSDKRDDDDLLGNISCREGGLREHLIWQLSMQGLSEEEFGLAEFIIGNIGDDGYLKLLDRADMGVEEFEAAVLAEISKYTGAPADMAARMLCMIQHFDPVGVGSRSIRECLLTQAHMMPVRDTVVEEIISGHIERLARKNYKGIAKKLGVSVDEVYEASKIISRCLNPTPGAGFGSDVSKAIIPDIFISKMGDEYVIQLNEDGMPKLKVNKRYREMMKRDSNASKQAKLYLQERFRSALWLIKSVHQRQRTIYKVVDCIVKFQKGFLDKGLKAMVPLVLKDVAAVTGVHESTVSRVTTNKYVQTPRGIFELKYFFNNSLCRSDGTDVTVEYIKEKVKAIIENEDSKNPLSDQRIVECLGKSGIKLARRTATKYREALGFLSSNRRKAHY
jgi:RNA polymerase sigma-54 factor